MKTTMNLPPKDAEELKTMLFSRRRFHEIGNRPDETVEQWHRRERRQWTVLWIVAIISTPIMIYMFRYVHHTYGSGPIPFWFALIFIPVSITSGSSCMMILMFFFLSPKESFGRWIIFGNGILYRYGKSPRVFIPFSEIRRIRIETSLGDFCSVVIQTDSETLRIPERSNDRHSGDTKDFLPFLNLLVQRMRQYCPEETAANKLVEQQTIIRRRIAERYCCRSADYLMMAAYFLPLFLLFPLFSWIQKVEYPMIWGVLIGSCFFFFALGWSLNRLVVRWKNRRIDQIIESLELADAES